MEMIAFIAQNSDVFDVQPDWNALPRVNTNSSKDDSTKAPPSKKQKNDDSSPPPPPSKFIEGVDIFLQSIGRYRKKQPSNDQQIEYLENACIALSSCIMFSTINLKHFVDLEGIPLVMYCEKNNVYSGCSALRLLDFSMEGDVPKRAAEEIVTSGLLKYLFPLFLGTRTPKPAIPLKNAKAKRSWLHDIKTRTIRILYGLSLHLDHTSPEDGQERFISKFVEDNLKNCDRLVELLLEFDEKARKAEYKVFRSDIDESIGEEQVALTAFDAKLKAGGDMCHRLAAIAAYVCAHSKRCHGRIISQLKLQQAGVSLLKESLTEFGSSLRPGKQQDHINGLIKQI
jgi:beta-catenin-like protein 1